HDGSIKTLEDVVKFYNNGGRLEETDPLSPFLDGGIRPLNLDDTQKVDLVEFLKALTSPEFAKQ
ncbi:MAG: cytochrome-c peroxidase, partial [Thermodesulfobacteriota bacterium]